MFCDWLSSGSSGRSDALCLTPSADNKTELIDRVGMHPKVYEAAKSGNLDFLKTKISEIEEDFSYRTTPKANNVLHVAAQYKQVNFIRGLLQSPSGPSLLWQGNCKGDTPLHVAAKVGSHGAVRVFTDLAKSLCWAAEKGQVDACKELLRKPNSNKDTALHHAVRGGHQSVVKLLIEEDHQLCSIANAADESPLYLAANRKLPGITELILGPLSPSSSHKGPKGLTTLHTAMYSSQTSWWKIVKERPEVIREGDDLGWTPLHYVSCIGKVMEVRLLLQHYTSAAYDLDKEGQSALHIAAFQGHVKVIDAFFRSCPDACDIINTRGQTALHAAVIGGQVNAVKYILGNPNLEDLINEHDSDGNTALHLAALHKQYNIIYILARDSRVDKLATNKDHWTALDIFSAHKQVGHRAAKVDHLLNGSQGMPFYQDWVIQYVRKSLDKHYIDGQRTASRITGSNSASPENFSTKGSILDLQQIVDVLATKNFDSTRGSIFDLQQIVSGLIATVTFAATFTMPGGYNQDDGPEKGMAVLADRAAFQAFVIFNVMAFGLSVTALYLQFDTCIKSDILRERYTKVASYCMYGAILAMVLAFVCGTYVVLGSNTGLGIVPFLVSGCLVTAYVIGGFLDPDAPFWWLSSSISPRRYVRNLLIDYGIL